MRPRARLRIRAASDRRRRRAHASVVAANSELWERRAVVNWRMSGSALRRPFVARWLRLAQWEPSASATGRSCETLAPHSSTRARPREARANFGFTLLLGAHHRFSSSSLTFPPRRLDKDWGPCCPSFSWVLPCWCLEQTGCNDDRYHLKMPLPVYQI